MTFLIAGASFLFGFLMFVLVSAGAEAIREPMPFLKNMITAVITGLFACVGTTVAMLIIMAIARRIN